MRILVCGNRCEHEWPESCVRTLEALGHEVQLLDFRWPREGDLDAYVPAAVQKDVPYLLDRPEGRKALQELVFYNLAIEFQPQLILLAGMYHSWSADALADVREALGVPIVMWSGDDPEERGATDIFTCAQHYDLTLFTIFGLAERVADRFPRTGFLPFACDPVRDAAPDVEEEILAPYRCDVGYLGTIKLDRAEMLERLAREDLDLKVWGVGLPRDFEQDHPALARAYRREHVQGDAKRLVYGGSRITLNLHHNGFGNMKFYEAASCGAFQISNLRRDAEAIREELPFFSQVVTYDDAAELPALVRHWLDHPEERAENARELQRIVRAQHTWAHRLRTLIGLAVPVEAA